MKYKVRIDGLDCANCALELEEIIQDIEGVKSCNVSFTNSLVFVECDENIINLVIDACNNFEEVKVIDSEKEKRDDSKLDLIFIIISIGLFIIGVVLSYLTDLELLYKGLYIFAYLLCGYPVLKNTFKNIIKGKIFDESFLMTIASIGAMLINEVAEGAIVMILYQIGEYLQNKAVSASRKEIINLMDLKVEEANLIVDNEVKKVKSEELKVGDIIQIRNGEKVPVDSIIIEGSSSFDTKSLTGEALLKDYQENDEIYASFINQGKVIKAKVIRNYNNSAISRVLNLIENSTESKAKSEKFITKFAKIYTPVVCIIAAIIGLLVPTILGIFNGHWSELFIDYMYKALILLVISCPCALVISVPLSYFSGVGACAKKGILVKGANYLDILSSVDIACFDKTGTLTEGNFKIVSYNSEEALLIASSAEKSTNHPLAKAFENIKSDYEFDEVEEISGRGLKCLKGQDIYLVGNKKLLQENQVEFEEIDSISTIIYVSKNNKFSGFIEIDDVIKTESKETLSLLKKLGIKELIMLSGDNQKRVEEVNKELNLTKVYGQLLPEQKLEKMNELKADGTVIYIGDGINDTPVMINADCSFSMGKLGSDTAIEASDIVLVEDNLNGIPTAIKISKKTRNIVLQNIIFSIVCKVLFMILGVLGIIPLYLAIFADVGVMLVAVLNSFRVKLGVK